jgi:hypothetical protein
MESNFNFPPLARREFLKTSFPLFCLDFSGVADILFSEEVEYEDETIVHGNNSFFNVLFGNDPLCQTRSAD